MHTELVKKIGSITLAFIFVSAISYGQNTFPATGNVLVNTATDNGNKLQVNGTAWVGENLIMAPKKTAQMGGIWLVDDWAGRYITTTNNGLKITSQAGGSITLNGQTTLVSTSLIDFHPRGLGVPAMVLDAATANPSSISLTLGFIRYDGPKKAVISTVDFDATSVSGATPVHLYLYPGKEIYSGQQGNIILSHDGNTQRGNVLIGSITDNGNKLQVTGSSSFNGAVRFQTLTNNNTYSKALVADDNGNVFYRDISTLQGNGGWTVGGNTGSDPLNNFIGTTDNQPIAFRTNNLEKMRIDANGNVGIGTAVTGTNKLAVEGTLAARKVKVTAVTPFPDYVFQSSYQLPSLSEIESFIKANHHLPEVPSADEVQKNGLDLGDNQTVLLKKIEELTLYIIEQNKKMEQKDKEIADIKSRLTEMDELKIMLKEIQTKINNTNP